MLELVSDWPTTSQNWAPSPHFWSTWPKVGRKGIDLVEPRPNLVEACPDSATARPDVGDTAQNLVEITPSLADSLPKLDKSREEAGTRWIGPMLSRKDCEVTRTADSLERRPSFVGIRPWSRTARNEAQTTPSGIEIGPHLAERYNPGRRCPVSGRIRPTFGPACSVWGQSSCVPLQVWPPGRPGRLGTPTTDRADSRGSNAPKRATLGAEFDENRCSVLRCVATELILVVPWRLGLSKGRPKSEAEGVVRKRASQESQRIHYAAC